MTARAIVEQLIRDIEACLERLKCDKIVSEQHQKLLVMDFEKGGRDSAAVLQISDVDTWLHGLVIEAMA